MTNRPYVGGPPVFSHRRTRVFLCSLSLIMIVLAGCSAPPARALDRARVQRVVSLVPSATEIIVLLGASDRLVGRTAYDTATAVAQAHSLGKNMQAAPEALAALQPDLIIDAHYARQNSALPVAHLTTDLQTLADILALIDTLGTLLGVQARADSMRAGILRAVAQLKSQQPARLPSVLYVVWPAPPLTAGRGTFINEVIELAGARNVFGDARTNWPEVSMESVLQRDPDYIIVPVEAELNAARLRALPGWRELRAVRRGHIIEVPQELFGRPGPRVIEAALMLRSELRERSEQ